MERSCGRSHNGGEADEGIPEPYRAYWRIYGGLPALVKSYYLWGALVLAVVCCPLWSRTTAAGERPVLEVLFAVIPGLLAFTLAGLAIVLALSGRRFADAVREGGKRDSYFMKVVALFFHFIVVLTLGLVVALLSASYPALDWLAGAAFFLAAYGVTSLLAIAAALFGLLRVYNAAIDKAP